MALNYLPQKPLEMFETPHEMLEEIEAIEQQIWRLQNDFSIQTDPKERFGQIAIQQSRLHSLHRVRFKLMQKTSPRAF